MTYEIYQLLDTQGNKLDVFVIWSTIADYVVSVADRQTTQKIINEMGLIGFDLDHPTELMDYRTYNQLTI